MIFFFVKGFPLEELLDLENFTSLLFYLGLLTIKGTDRNKLRLEIPNETIKRLYYDYIKGPTAKQAYLP